MAAAHPLAALPDELCERVLQHLGASDFAALACVSKASNARVRATDRWRVIRIMEQPGVDNMTALGKVLRCIAREEGSEALAASRLVCKAFYRAAYPHVRRMFRDVYECRAVLALLYAAPGEADVVMPCRRPRVSFWTPSPSDVDDE